MKNRLIILISIIFFCSVALFSQAVKSNTGQKKIKIGLIGKMKSNLFYNAVYAGAKLAARELGEKYNTNVEIEGSTPDKESVEEQGATIERFLLTGIDGIAVSCSNANYLTPIINKVAGKGIPIMCFVSDAPNSSRFAYFGADDVEFGRMLLRGLANEIHEKGTIAIIAGNKNGYNIQHSLEGIKDELKKYRNIVLPQENIIYNLDIPVIASETIARTQKANPNIKGWILMNSAALQIKNSFKWTAGEVKVVAGNAMPYELEYLANGYVQDLVGINCFQMGYRSVEILLDKIVKKKDPNDPVIHCPLTMVNDKNVKEWSANWNKWLNKETSK